MSLIKEIKYLLLKDIQLEWRQRFGFSSILLYVVITIYIVYISLVEISPQTWNGLLWIILLFTAVNAIAKSFMQESKERLLYYYTIASPQSIILAKMLYNVLLMLLMSFIGWGIYGLIVGNPVHDFGIFIIALILGATGFSLTFTMISLIASKANNSTTLMAILSFPIIIPMLIMLIKLSQHALVPINDIDFTKEIITLIALDVIIVTVSYLLFPYLWRD